VLRSGAKSGDVLFVSGPLGGSLRYGRHLTFHPRIDVARWLVNNVQLNGMMDLSDGLSMDLHRMMEASHTGAVLKTSSIPIHNDVLPNDPFPDRLAAALGDGEDFELLFSVPQPDAATIVDLARLSGLQLFEIGTVTQSRGLFLQDDDAQLEPLAVSGWQHKM
jgi:thiamine-monophosphate kinase